MSTSKTLVTCALVVIAFTCVAPLAADADSGRRFSNADVRGSFGSSMEGVAGTVPVTAVSRFTADGDGHIAGSRTLSFGGVILQQTFTCGYSVSSDGTGTAECTIAPTEASPESEESFAFVIVDKRDEGLFVSTTPGTIIRGVIKRQ